MNHDYDRELYVYASGFQSQMISLTVNNMMLIMYLRYTILRNEELNVAQLSTFFHRKYTLSLTTAATKTDSWENPIDYDEYL